MTVFLESIHHFIEISVTPFHVDLHFHVLGSTIEISKRKDFPAKSCKNGDADP